MSRLNLQDAIAEIKASLPEPHLDDALPLDAYENIRGLVAEVRRNVGRRLLPPVREAEARTILDYVEELLSFLDQELPFLITAARAAGSSDESLVETGEQLLGELSAHQSFAHHYFDPKVIAQRDNRPSYEVHKELEVMELRSNQLKEHATAFLASLQKLLEAATTSAR